MLIFVETCCQTNAPADENVNVGMDVLSNGRRRGGKRQHLIGRVITWAPQVTKMLIFAWTCDQMDAPGGETCNIYMAV